MSTLILMATYNGEQFVDQQIESIVKQTNPDWTMLISDDGSTDTTRKHIERWVCEDRRIQLIEKSGPGLGPLRNFSCLMDSALHREEPYVAFCDQDDVWLPDKLERQLDEIQRLESALGRDCPILIHTDLEIVDESLVIIHPSIISFQMINHPSDTSPSMLISQNHVVGCSMLINRALLHLACPVPEMAYMHDWWLALCASTVGFRSYLPSSLVRYRQHADNQVGAKGVSIRLFKPLQWVPWIRKMNRLYIAALIQAHCLRQRLKKVEDTHTGLVIHIEWLEQIDLFLDISNYPRVSRPWILWQAGWRRQNIVMTVLFYLQSLFMSSKDFQPQRREGPYH